MNVTITGKNIDVGTALRSHIESELQEIVAKYFDKVINCTVVLNKDGAFFHVDISLLVGTGNGIKVKSEFEADEAYAAFNGAVVRLAKQLRRYKKRLRNHHNTRTADAIEMLAAMEYVVEHDAHLEEETTEDNPIIIAEMSSAIEAMTVKDAVMRLDLSNAPLFLFRNSKSSNVNVVYRRPDGNIGWVDPKAA
jgi:ribosomal subunit interface protein